MRKVPELSEDSLLAYGSCFIGSITLELAIIDDNINFTQKLVFSYIVVGLLLYAVFFTVTN